MVQLTDNLFAAEVPESDSVEGYYFIHDNMNFGHYILYPQYGGMPIPKIKSKREPEIIGLFKDITEEQAKELIEEWRDARKPVKTFDDFLATAECETHKETIEHWMKEQWLEPDKKNYLLIKKL